MLSLVLYAYNLFDYNRVVLHELKIKIKMNIKDTFIKMFHAIVSIKHILNNTVHFYYYQYLI
jgi:hypothetical protein